MNNDSTMHIHLGNEPRTLVVHTDDGLSVNIQVSDGPHGLGVTLLPQEGSPLTLTGNLKGSGEVIPQVDTAEVSAVVYRGTEAAQKFKKWYGDPDALARYPVLEATDEEEHPG